MEKQRPQWKWESLLVKTVTFFRVTGLLAGLVTIRHTNDDTHVGSEAGGESQSYCERRRDF